MADVGGFTFENMYDSKLKVTMLYEVMASHFPPEKLPSPKPLQLSSALSTIRRGKLLSESKRDDIWKAALDAWNERILSYADAKMPDKCWAGICMLGVTCQECHSQRFLESYHSWYQKLLIHLKLPNESPFLKVAACASLSDLLSRLGGFPSMKKEGTSLVGKLVQPVLQLLGEDGSETIWNNAADLFCAILKSFPSCLQSHYDTVESVLVAKIFSGKCSLRICQKFARCLAFLPKSRSDGATWYSMMQRVLLAINAHLNNAFQGFEEVNKASEAVVSLLPPGKDPPPPLGGPLVEAESVDQARKKFWHLLVPRVSSLLHCCCLMLTNPYPVQVTVPLGPLLALVSRILNVNGSLYQQAVPLGISSQQQALLCSELPALHSCALDLLTAIIKGVRSQLLPRAATIVRLITEYFKCCISPALRVKLYCNARNLLFSMGVGMASYLAPAIIYNAIADLKASNCGGILSSPNVQGNSACISGGDSETNPRKRRKIQGLSAESSVPSELERELDANDAWTSISVQISALQALEALLTVGGALRSDRWRAEVDLILVTVAMNAPSNSSRLQFCNEEDISFFEESTSHTIADFQLAAYRALLASLLSPSSHRPPYLSQGLALFRRGRQESGTELAEFCAHALLALEPLIHPRSLPYGAPPTVMATGMASGRGIQGNIDLGVQKSSMFIPNSDSGPSILGSSCAMAFGSSIKIGQHSMQIREDDFYRDDEIYLGWLGNGDDSVAEQNNLYDSSEMPIESLVQSLTENRELYCSPIHEMENLGSVQPSIDGSVHSIAVGGISDPHNEPDIGTFPRDSVETGRNELMGTSEAHRSKVDAAQDAFLAVSRSKTIDSVVSTLSVPVVASVENLLHEQANVGTAATSRDTVLPESAMAIHTETNVVEAIETDAIILESQQQTETRIETEQPARNLQLPLHLKSHYISSTAESDSDAIPDIVDGDPDTD